MSTLCNCIALYDFTPASANLKDWFASMEQWAEQVQIPWLTMGHPASKKLIQFKSGKRKIDSHGFDDVSNLELLGGVTEPGTSVQWKTTSSISSNSRTLYLCFRETVAGFDQATMQELLVKLLPFADFKYGIGYQRDYAYGPEWYPFGILQGDSPDKEEDMIAEWARKYGRKDGKYCTGLLRDIYPYNVLINTHLQQ